LEDAELGAHLTRYINRNDSGHYKRYFPLFETDKNSNNQETV